MGNQLEKPVTTKDTRKGAAFDFVYCASGMQGYRANNEDTVMTKEKVCGPTVAAMFGVFDGHGGARMSNEALALETYVFSETEALNLENKEAVAKALSDGFLAFDGAMSKSQLTQMGLDSSGTTAIVAVLNEKFVYFSNAGDSRGAYYRNGKCLFGTKDHKPSLPEELERITKAGGTVTWDRVCGDLAVSRGFGDFTYKKQEGDPREFMVTALPDVNFFQRDEQDDFIVLACDGLWDVLSNEEMGTGVRSLLFKHQGNHQLVVEELVDEALKLGSSDNLSAVVIFFAASQKYHTTSTNETWPPERKAPPTTSSSSSSASSAPVEPAGPTSAEQNGAQAPDDGPKLNPL